MKLFIILTLFLVRCAPQEFSNAKGQHDSGCDLPWSKLSKQIQEHPERYDSNGFEKDCK